MVKFLYAVQGADRRAIMYGDRSCFKCHKVSLHMTQLWFYFLCKFGDIVYVDFFCTNLPVLLCRFVLCNHERSSQHVWRWTQMDCTGW